MKLWLLCVIGTVFASPTLSNPVFDRVKELLSTNTSVQELGLEENPASPIQIARFDHGEFSMDTSILETILLQPQYEDKQIAIISIVGGARTGKSFLLNFFIMYLRALTETGKTPNSLGSEWMNDNDLGRFHFASGLSPVTTGINIYQEPFVIKNDDGNETVVLLMDTQGTFSHDTTARDCATIFALTSLFSSHMIFNEMRNFQEQHLQHLRLSLDIANMFENKTIYEGLTFLVRDADLSTELGREGGAQYFADKIEPNRNQSLEAQELRKAIRASFKNLDAFLLPYPGKKFARKVLKEQPLLADVDEDFLQFAKSFVETVPYAAKKIGDRPISTREWVDIVKKIGEGADNHTIVIEDIHKMTCDLDAQHKIQAIFESSSEIVAKEAFETGIVFGQIRTALDKLRASKVLCGVKKEHEEELKLRLEEIASVGLAKRTLEESNKMMEELRANEAANEKKLAELEAQHLAVEAEYKRKALAEAENLKEHAERMERLEEMKRKAEQKNQELQEEIATARKRKTIFGVLGAIGGAIAGFFAGGPAGAAVGASAGGALGAFGA